MDYTDGSKEAKLFQELLHFLEEAIFKGSGSAEGNFPDLIMKEMKKKGFNSHDFTFIRTYPEYADQYHKALVAANIPYVKAKDIHGNIEMIVRTEDTVRLLDIDASIKKGSSKYTRAAYIQEFIRNEQALGHEIYRLPMSDPRVHNILANKAFDHEAGFVTSYHDGYCYFSESAADSGIATIFLETAIASEQNTHIKNVKEMNNLHEQLNVQNVIDALQNNGTCNFVNVINNHADYIHVEDGILSVHSYIDHLDTVVTSYNVKDYVNNDEALHHVIAKELAQIHNCEEITQKEFSEYKKLTRGELAERRDELLLTQAKLISDLKDDPHPASFSFDSPYLSTDQETLFRIENLLKKKIATAQTPEQKKEYSTWLKNNRSFHYQKSTERQIINHVKKEVAKACAMNAHYKHFSSKDKIEYQLNIATYTIENSDFYAFNKYAEYTGTTREELVGAYKDHFGTIEAVSESAQRNLTTNQSQQPTVAPQTTI